MTVVLAVVLGGVAAVQLTQFSPTVTHYVFLGAFVAGSPVGLLAAALTVGVLYSPDRVFLHEVDAGDGSVRGHELAPETAQDLIVQDHNGNELGREYLHPIDTTFYSEAYEVDEYDEETNVATISWMGGATNREIRRHQSLLGQVKETLSPLARSYTDLHARMDLVVEDSVSDAMNSLLGMVEGIELPPGEEMHQKMSEEAGRDRLDDLPTPDEALSDLDAARGVEEGRRRDATTGRDAGDERA